MLTPQTPYPEVGSYALLIDPDMPPPQPAELVRILERGASAVLVAFPLREGAGGNKRVALADLIDATELTPAEAREFADLDRELAGRPPRTRRQKERAARRDALKLRAIWNPALRRLMRGMAAVQRRRAA